MRGAEARRDLEAEDLNNLSIEIYFMDYYSINALFCLGKDMSSEEREIWRVWVVIRVDE